MRQLVKMQFGSHVYGTNVPESDHDFKGIFIPPAKDIILQKAVKTSINESTKKDPTKKNESTDVDFENFSLHGFLKLCAEGQTVAMDMLFTPREFWLESSDVWEELVEHRLEFICSNASAFTGYCLKQAGRYGLKGSRLDALKAILDLLKCLPVKTTRDTLGDFAEILRKHATETKHTEIVHTVKTDRSGKIVMEEDYLGVCGRKSGFNSSVNQAIEMYQNLYDKYGDRAKLAQSNQGVDWKAMMHAVRVCHEAIELLSSGGITFPRPEKDLLLKIRKGEMPYDEVSEIVVNKLEEVKEAEKNSVLQDKVDGKLVDSFVLWHYGHQINRTDIDRLIRSEGY